MSLSELRAAMHTRLEEKRSGLCIDRITELENEIRKVQELAKEAWVTSTSHEQNVHVEMKRVDESFSIELVAEYNTLLGKCEQISKELMRLKERESAFTHDVFALSLKVINLTEALNDKIIFLNAQPKTSKYVKRIS